MHVHLANFLTIAQFGQYEEFLYCGHLVIKSYDVLDHMLN